MNLGGVFPVDVSKVPSLTELSLTIEHLMDGGSYAPKECTAREKLAIIIPYRDRETNLVLLLKYLHPFLQKQARYYRIILIEQVGWCLSIRVTIHLLLKSLFLLFKFGNDIFNKGRIMNIAVEQALKIDDFDCFIFHDVDLIPENDKNIYECYSHPRHLSPAVDELRYKYVFGFFGGHLIWECAFYHRNASGGGVKIHSYFVSKIFTALKLYVKIAKRVHFTLS